MKPESELIRLGWLKPDEARESVDLAGSHLKPVTELIRLGWLKPDEAFADLHEHANCTAWMHVLTRLVRVVSLTLR
jgi:hypothetical protein